MALTTTNEQLSSLNDSYCGIVDSAHTAIQTTVPEQWQFSTDVPDAQVPGASMPPHLKLASGKIADIPDPDQRYEPKNIFHQNPAMFREIKLLVAQFKADATFGTKDYRDPKKRMVDLKSYNDDCRHDKTTIGDQPNVGDRPDWYSDAIFAQQFFTGPNPTSITLASKCTKPSWVDEFRQAAVIQNNSEVLNLISSSSADDFYIADYSYFRDVLQLSADSIITSGPEVGARYGCASVTLFHLVSDKVTGKGKLHPLAIILDYKGTIEKSVVIFNKRISPEITTPKEKTDWPWRYAKTCVMVSDWAHHEIAVHLVNTHLVEEVVIVAAHRAFSSRSGIFRLLKAHWDKTLALNYAARKTLVPLVIIPISPFTEPQVYKVINAAYANFEWTRKYIPADLSARGFSDDELNTPRFHNYTYARNMKDLWPVLRQFVTSYLESFPEYDTDEKVAQDAEIASWVNEMRNQNSGALTSFPEIKTRGELIDALTMCIHIAAPQHTAINYLQNYYQAFVAAKPPALYNPLPNTLEQLQGYKELDLVQALPIVSGNHWKLASHLPYLLSLRNEADQSLVTYADSLASDKTPEAGIRKAGAEFKSALDELKKRFEAYSDEIDAIPPIAGLPVDVSKLSYTVLIPENTPASILI